MRHLPAVLTILAILPMPGMAQEMRSMTGQVRYLDRMALPDDAAVLVEVTGADGEILSETRLPTNGQQVPLPFALDVPVGEDVLVRAGITLGTDLIWLGDPMPGTQTPLDLVLQRHQPIGFTTTFRCGDQVVRTGYADDALVLDTGVTRVTLQAVAAASGARYDSQEDPGTFFWKRGDTALISVDDVELPECRIALPSVSAAYVAQGNEPFWTLRLEDGEMRIDWLAKTDQAMPITDAGLQSDGAIFVTAGKARLLRENKICHDDMSGMPFPETATLTLGDETYTGCGGDRRDVLTGRTWVVTDIAGENPGEDIRITLEFDAAGRVAGAGGCNSWFAGYALDGEGLRFTEQGATMMACAEPAMAEERRFFSALAEVSGFEIAPDGALVLLGMPGPLITAETATENSAP